MTKFKVYVQGGVNGESALVPVTVNRGQAMIIEAHSPDGEDGNAALAMLRRPCFWPVLERVTK